MSPLKRVLADASFSPLNDNQLWSWGDPSDLATITEAGGFVSQLDDKSGNSNHYTQGTGASQPATGATTVNGLNIFDYLGDYLELPDMSALTGGFTIYRIMKNTLDPPTVIGLTGVDWLGGSAQSSHYAYTDGVVYLDTGSTARKTCGNPVTDLTGAHILRVTSVAGEFTVTINNETLFTTATNTVGLNTTPRIGAYSGTFVYNGSIGEMIIRAGAPDAALHTNYVSYLAAKWGVTL